MHFVPLLGILNGHPLHRTLIRGIRRLWLSGGDWRNAIVQRWRLRRRLVMVVVEEFIVGVSQNKELLVNAVVLRLEMLHLLLQKRISPLVLLLLESAHFARPSRRIVVLLTALKVRLNTISLYYIRNKFFEKMHKGEGAKLNQFQKLHY